MLAAWKERGQEPPKSFLEQYEDQEAIDEPETDWIEQDYLRLFDLASSCRSYTFGQALPIPYSAIADILDRNGYVGEDFRTALYVIRGLDKAVMQMWDTK